MEKSLETPVDRKNQSELAGFVLDDCLIVRLDPGFRRGDEQGKRWHALKLTHMPEGGMGFSRSQDWRRGVHDSDAELPAVIPAQAGIQAL